MNEYNDRDSLEQKWFSKTGKLTYFKGLEIHRIIEDYTNEIKHYTKRTLHDLRRYIFCLQGMQRLKSMNASLKLTINYQPYKYNSQFECVLLRACGRYHPTHIKKVAEDISKFGEAKCSTCNATCQNASDIMLDALVHSYYFKVKNYESSTLVFRTTRYGSLTYKQLQQNIYSSENRTMIKDKGDQGAHRIMELQILQIDVKDERINSNFANQDLIEKMEFALKLEKSCEYEVRELNSISYPLVTNLICFSTFARIRNPLIHKQCRPSQHKNRLILYSYQHVFCEIYNKKKDKDGKTKTKAKKIKCMYAKCQNYFDAQNFAENAIIISNLKIPIYEELQQNLFGSYYSSIYQKNWHNDLAKTMLENSDSQNRHLVQRYIYQIKSYVTSLITAANLGEAQKKIKYLYKKCKQDPNNKIMWAQFQSSDMIMIVTMGDFNLCPVRCLLCNNLNSLDVYKLSYLFLKNTEKKCPLCNTEKVEKGKSFHDYFYVDTKLMRFIFFQGYAQQIYFDVIKKQFFHRLDYYTGISLKQKLKHEKKTTSQNMHKYDMQIKLQKSKRYIPFMDRRCKEVIKGKPEQINKHYIYLVDSQKIPDNTKCPECKKKIRVDQLEFNEQLEYILKNQKNQLKWSGSKDNQFYAKNKAIVSIKFYSQIQKQYSIKNEKCKFYWKNYQGTLIKYPFRFKKCEHPFETTICDFGDILHQSRFQGATKFKCRYKECNLVYQSAQELEKLDIDIYKTLNESQNNMRDVIQNNKYWITFNFETGGIIQISDKFNSQWSEHQQLEQIDKYRNKFLNGEQIQSKKEVLQKLAEVERSIKVQKLKMEEDLQEIKQNGIYKHSSNQQEFNNLKSDLRLLQKKRQDLQEIKRKLQAQQQEQSRKQNNTNSINFNHVSKQYYSQLKNLKEKKQTDEVNYNNIVNFQDFQLYGNIYPFIYELPVFRNHNRVVETAHQLKKYLEGNNLQQGKDKKIYRNVNAEKMKKK